MLYLIYNMSRYFIYFSLNQIQVLFPSVPGSPFSTYVCESMMRFGGRRPAEKEMKKREIIYVGIYKIKKIYIY